MRRAAPAVLALFLGHACVEAPARVPTCVVARAPFRNEVLAFGRLRAVHSTPVTVPPDLNRPMRIAWLAPTGPVKKGDPVVVFDPTEIERQQQDGLSNRASAESRKRKAEAEGRRSLRELDLDRTVAAEQLRRAEEVEPADEQIFSRATIIEGRLDRQLLETRLRTSDAKRGPVQRLSEADVALAEIERKKADVLVGQAERSLKSLKVAAPHDGILVFPLSWRGDAAAVGDTVWAGQPVAELPDLTALEARVFVLEGDAGGLAVGKKAVVEIEGQPGLRFAAEVSQVDALAKTQDRQSPVKYFETTIPLPASAVSLKPGQTVRALILVDDRGDAVTVPRGALFERDGRRIVYRREGARFVPVEVVVGRRSLGQVVIEAGVAPGDVVALRDPETAASASLRDAGSAAAPAGR
jgi:HlyD family secretion protein